MGVPLSGHAV